MAKSSSVSAKTKHLISVLKYITCSAKMRKAGVLFCLTFQDILGRFCLSIVKVAELKWTAVRFIAAETSIMLL